MKSPEEIWHLLETADNFLKYGSDQRSIERARKRYAEALSAAEAARLLALAEQAKRRLEELERLEGPEEGGADGSKRRSSTHDGDD